MTSRLLLFCSPPNRTVSDDGKLVRAGGSRGQGVGAGDDNWLWMSAVCYLYGLNIHTSQRVPVGLINTNWGGTLTMRADTAGFICLYKNCGRGQ